MLYHITTKDLLVVDDDGMYGACITVGVVKISDAYPGEVADWFRRNQIENWLKQNCAYYTKIWSTGNGKSLTIEFQYEQHLKQFKKIWL